MEQNEIIITISENAQGSPVLLNARTRAGTDLPKNLDLSEIGQQIEDIIAFVQKFEDNKDAVIKENEKRVAELESEVTRLKRMFRPFYLGEQYSAGEKVYDIENDKLLVITYPLDENSTIEDVAESTKEIERGK